MTVYYYKATDQEGKFVQGQLEAPDARSAALGIRQMQYFPVEVSEQKIVKNLSLDIKIPGSDFFTRTTAKELMLITQQLGTLVNASLTLDESLASVARLAEKETTQKMLADIHSRVHAGSSFAEALSEYPKVFSKLYVNMIRAGETGGMLGESLTRLAGFMEKSDDLKQNIRSAVTYPAILVVVSALAVGFLFTFVIPKFSALFADAGDALPAITKFLLAISAWVVPYWSLMLAFLVLVTIGFTWYLKTESGLYKWHRLLLKLPLIGTLIRKVEVSRFSLTMATLLRSGVPVLPALDIVKTILGNRLIIAAMDPVHQGLKSGKGLSGPLKQTEAFPAMAVHMITVGETSGQLEEMLTQVSQTYDKEVERSVKQLISLVEPMLIVFMACVIGFIVVAMLLGIFSVNDIAF